MLSHDAKHTRYFSNITDQQSHRFSGPQTSLFHRQQDLDSKLRLLGHRLWYLNSRTLLSCVQCWCLSRERTTGLEGLDPAPNGQLVHSPAPSAYDEAPDGPRCDVRASVAMLSRPQAYSLQTALSPEQRFLALRQEETLFRRTSLRTPL